MGKNYSVTRENAAKALWISTRTVDRYVKSGKLSYKKVANKVLLSKEEIAELQKDFGSLRQETSSEVVWPMSTAKSVTAVNPSIEQAIDAKIEKFFLIFNEKDKILEEKNKVIFMLQQRIWELETKIKTMVALPDYSRENKKLLLKNKSLRKE